MKKFLLFGLLGFLTLFFVVISVVKNTTTIPGVTSFPTPTPLLPPADEFHSVTYTQIFKDPATAKGMGEKLQSPLFTEKKGDFVIGHFASDSASLSTEVYAQNGVAKFVIQTIITDNSYYNDYLLTHDEKSSHTLYDPIQTGSGFLWKVFSENGVAFFTNPISGFAGQILYFAPTSYTNFLTQATQLFHLSTSQPSDQGGGLEKGE